jgi:hypothetical protein
MRAMQRIGFGQGVDRANNCSSTASLQKLWIEQLRLNLMPDAGSASAGQR